MHANDGRTSTLQSALLCLVAVALAGTVGMIGLVRQVGEMGPKVGDIVSFDPLQQLSRDMKAQLTATPAPGGPTVGCTLDVRAMHDGGGSLVIEAREPETPRAYRVHWAGARTSYDATDCGASADFLLDQDDLSVLASAAGGFGVTAKKMSGSTLWRSPDTDSRPSQHAGT